MSHYVYAIVNKINLKLYFGSHSWEGTGVDKNYYGSGKIIKQAVRKYGKDNFIIQPIKFYDSVEECRRAEEELLTKYDISNNPYCYNLKNSAIGSEKGLKLSEETRKKISQALKGKTVTFSDEHRKKISQALKGKKLTDATRQKMSQSRKGRKFSEEHRKKLSIANKGKTLSEKQKDALSQARNYQKTPLVAIQIDTGKVKIFESQGECSRVLGILKGSVNKCLRGRCKTCKGYLIKYLKRCSKDYKITKRKAKKTEKIKLTTKRKGTTPVIAIPKNAGRVRMFLSQAECCRVLGILPGHINYCLKGRCKTCKGYVIKKINRDKRVFKVSQRSKADINRLRGVA